MNKISIFSIVVAVHLLSQVQLFVIPQTAACQAFLSFSVSQNFLKLMFVESMTLSNHLILCHSLHSCPLSFPASGSSIFCPWVLYRFSLFHFLFFSVFCFYYVIYRTESIFFFFHQLSLCLTGVESFPFIPPWFTSPEVKTLEGIKQIKSRWSKNHFCFYLGERLFLQCY